MNEINDKTYLDKIINSYIHPYIRPPFPPIIDPKDLITKPIGSNKPNRAPNAFIIYRKMYVREARNEGYCFPMTVLSSMVGQSWEKEPEEVKIYYKKLAKEAYDYRNKLYPKPESKRKRRSNWNVISFEKIYENSHVEYVESKKIPTSTPSNIDDDNNQTEWDFINQISTPDLSHESSTATSPIIDDDANAINSYSNPGSNLLFSSNEDWKFNKFNSCCEQHSFENFQQEINSYSCDDFSNQIINEQNFSVFQNQEMFYNYPQLNYYQVNPSILTSSSSDIFGIYEGFATLQPYYSNLDTIPDNNTCVFEENSY